MNLVKVVNDGKLNDLLQGNGDFAIDKAQLRNILGIKNMDESYPTYWDEILEYPEQVKLFCFVAILFTHHSCIKIFAKSAKENMKGVLLRNEFENPKVFTNIRALLVKSEASNQEVLSEDEVPYDLSNLFISGEVGLLVKELLYDRLVKIGWSENIDDKEKDFFRDFFEQSLWYNFHKVFSLSEKQFVEWMKGEPQFSNEKVVITYNPILLEKEVEIDVQLLVSLSTKPFLILTGPSGTGKTISVRNLASSLNVYKDFDEEYNIAFVPVEAGWKDGRHLLGYINPFTEDGEKYQTTPLIEILLKANYHKNIDCPYFIILDEMNLSHVEMYFAKFLSLLEVSKHDELSNIPLLTVKELTLLKKNYQKNSEYLAYVNDAITYGGLFLRKNIFIIGTVNIDETTYMFSPKVLDRAFVIEKNSKKPSDISNRTVISERFKATMKIKDVVDFLMNETIKQNDFKNEVVEFLDQVYEIVEDFPFGFRVVKEACDFYLKANELCYEYNISLESLQNIENIFDEILMQKILPKIHGNRKQLSDLLNNLIKFCYGGIENNKPRYPRSHEKLKTMQKMLENIGHCGFIC